MYHCISVGDPVKGREYIETTLGEADLTEEVQIIVPTMVDLVASYAIEGRFMRICELAPKVIDLIEQSCTEKELFGRTSHPYSILLSYCGMSLGALGNFEEGARSLEKGLSLARHVGNLHSLAMVEMLYGIFHYYMGDGPNQVKHYRASLDCMEKSQMLVFQGLVRGWLGMACSMMDQPEKALKHLEEGLRIHTDSGLPFFLGNLHAGLCNTHLEMGELQKARVHGEQALGLSQQNKERYFEAESSIAHGRAVGAAGPEHFEEGRDCILQGMGILEELHVRSREAVGLLYLAELQTDAGRKAEALENLKKAESMFREMGMDYWLGKTQEVWARL